MGGEAIFFADSESLRDWFAANASTATELLVGFTKSKTGTASLTWPQAVDEALCVGWIDGVRRRIDDQHYQIRFTPRKTGSNWSDVNIRRVAALQAVQRMLPAGLAAFAARTDAKSRTASYEQETTPKLSAAEVQEFKRLPAAWIYYEALPPSYKCKVTWWVISAKQPATRKGRLGKLVQACHKGKRL